MEAEGAVASELLGRNGVGERVNVDWRAGVSGWWWWWCSGIGRAHQLTRGREGVIPSRPNRSRVPMKRLRDMESMEEEKARGEEKKQRSVGMR